MKGIRRSYDEFYNFFSRNAFKVFLALLCCSCNKKLAPPPISSGYYADSTYIHYQPTKKKLADWNVLFASGTNEATRIQTLESIKLYVSNFMASHNPSITYDQFYFNCPCDPLLYNFTVTPLTASGTPPVQPPSPGKGVGGSGDGIEYVDINYAMSTDDISENSSKPSGGKKIFLNTTSTDNSKILAVMDTGLDSAYYQNLFHGLLWTQPGDAGDHTLRNFQFFTNGLPLGYFWDDDRFKHGTAVTALALQALEKYNDQTTIKPSVMILKVLDNNRNGSTFTVSCALKYAMINNATVVNASLGYYNSSEDSILLKYVHQCDSLLPHPLTIFAAAGNLQGAHDRSRLCDKPNVGNLLNPPNLFFPGCFSIHDTNVITVTGLKDPLNSCFYQNYSDTYVNVGVVMNPLSSNCCKFKVDFNSEGYEGSSFATPIVSGKVMACLLTTPGTGISNCLNLISTVPNPIPNKPPTTNGRFLNYSTP